MHGQKKSGIFAAILRKVFLRDPNKPIFTNKLNLFIMKKVFLFAIAALMSASMFASTCAEVLAAMQAAGEGKVTAEMTVVGYVTEIAEVPNPIYNNMSFWIADEAGAANVIQIYRLSWKDVDPANIPVVGDQVTVKATFTLYKPKSGDAIPETKAIKEWSISKACDCIRWTADDLTITDVTVQGALDVADEMLPSGAAGDKKTTAKFYRVKGYMTGNTKDGAWSETYKNQSFYMSDEIGTKMGFQAYRASTATAIEEGAYVGVTGQITKNFYDSNGTLKAGYEIASGKAEVLPEPQAINNVNAEAVKAMKVIENGQLYIIRNGVKYNAAGAIVK